MNVSILIPRPLASTLSNHDAPSLKAWVIESTQNAVKAGLDPLFVDTSHPDNYNLKMYLRQSFLAVIPRVDGHTIPATVTGLVNAWVVHQRAGQLTGKSDKIGLGEGRDGMRPEQIKLIEHSETGIAKGSIVLAEAGTGVGKSRAALAMAARFADRTGKNAIIAVPTIAVLSQVIGEYEHLDCLAMGLSTTPRIGYVIGKGSFVDPEKLSEFMDGESDDDDMSIDEQTKDTIRQWIKEGAGHVPGAKTAPLHQINDGIGWLVEDLQHLVPEIPANELRLVEDSPSECPSMSAYNAIRNAALSCQIVVCTHVMLGISVIRAARSAESASRRITELESKIDTLRSSNRQLSLATAERELRETRALLTDIEQDDRDTPEAMGGILPKYGLLIIDEAHQLESGIATLRRSELAPRKLAQEIIESMPLFSECKKKTMAESLITSLNRLHTELTFTGMRNRKKNNILLGESQNEDQSSILKIMAEILALNTPQVWGKCPAIRRLLQPMNTVAKNAAGKGSMDAVYVNFSPKRRFPTIFTGPNTIRRLMERIWDSAEAAVLLSATLTIPDVKGLPRSEFIIRQLAIPSSRLNIIPPITQPWLYAPLLVTTGKERNDLIPPSETGQDGETDTGSNDCAKNWARAIATEIVKAHETGKGGLLALTSSYLRAELINGYIKEIIKTPDVIVEQTRKRGLRSSQAEFEHKAREGIRPIWVSTGGAWTGLDIRASSSPEDDFMLTDLVIVNIPFGTNRSTTHQQRMEHSRIAERDRAALEFKQGIGRLMRRGGVSSRRLHILDPRVWNPSPFYIPFRKILERYGS